MANETILVVDDAPVNLKLTDILLRKEGYKVHSATDAEQALSLLRTFHPDLMLVDIQLPGMDGLELTRRIKQNHLTRNIVCVALTACAMKGDDERAYQAGFDGYITKPIETLTLGKRVREYLEKAAVKPASDNGKPPQVVTALPGGLTLTGPEMESLRRRFLEEGILQTRQFLENLNRQFDVPKAMLMVQGWAAAADLLDYPLIAILAREVEKELDTQFPDAGPLREKLSNLMLAFVEPPEATINPVPQFIEEVLTGKRIALVGCGEDEAEHLCSALERAGSKPRLFDAADAPDSDSVRDCAAIVVHVRQETQKTPWLGADILAQSRHPLILIGARDDIIALPRAVQTRACELLIDGWQPEEALLRIGSAFSRCNGARFSAPACAPAATLAAPADPKRSTPAAAPSTGLIRSDVEVLIADDDMTVRMLVRSALQSAGIRSRMACNGSEALQMLREFRPTAAILDVNMPEMDGYEVLAALRNESIPARVILLTARQQESDITRGFTLGADDYVVKPFNLAELVARLKRFLLQ